MGISVHAHVYNLFSFENQQYLKKKNPKYKTVMMKTHNSIQGRDLDWPVSDLGGFRVAVKPNVIIPNCRSSRHSTAASHRMAFSNPSSLLSSCSVHRLNPLLFTHRRQTITLSRWHIHRSRPRFLAGNAIAFFPSLFPFLDNRMSESVSLRKPN